MSKSMLDAVRRLVDDVVLPSVERWDREDVLPQEVLDRLGELGVPGALVPAAYGGRELPVSAMVDVWRTLSQGWISLTGAVNTTALATALLVRYGTEEQRARWLPGIAAGEVWASFSITEPGAGSDLRRIETWVEPADGGLLDHRPQALDRRRVLVPARVHARQRARVSCGRRASCCPPRAAGARRGRSSRWTSSAIAASSPPPGSSTATTRPGRRSSAGSRLGQGARQMLDVLAVGRVNVACRGLGIIDRALECALDEATGRGIGRGVLGDHTHTQLRIGEMRSRQLVVEAAVRRAATAIDAGERRRGRAGDRGEDDGLRERGLGGRARLAPRRQPLLHRRVRARPPAPRRSADADRRGRQRRAADRRRQAAIKRHGAMSTRTPASAHRR